MRILAQANDSKNAANSFFSSGNLRDALPAFLKLLENDPENTEYNHKTALCYLYLNTDKTKAIPYLELVTKKDNFENEAWFDLGYAYHHALKFDDAVKAYTKYGEKAAKQDIEKADLKIKMCLWGKELVKHPRDVTFENLGSEINSPYPDYYPYIPADESFIIFTTRRKGVKGNLLDFDGLLPSDVFIAYTKKGKFYKPREIGGGINTDLDEQAVGLSSDGENLFLYVDHIDIYGDLYIVKKKRKSFSEVIKPGNKINTPALETAGCISDDGSTLFFASNINGGYGGTDLYMTKKLPSGDWGIPVNLGTEINTIHDEDFPYLAPDGKTLYFSSQGHNTMGGFDIFRTLWNENLNEWETPVNLGYPVNTPADNMTISFSAIYDNTSESVRMRHAYISAYRNDSYGDLDLYKVTFNDVEPAYSVIRGIISARVEIIPQKVFYIYKKGESEQEFPEELNPWHDKSWSFVEKKEIPIKEGYEYKTRLLYDKNGKIMQFTSELYPKNDARYVFKEIQNNLVKKKNYKPGDEKNITYQSVNNAVIIITDNKSGKETGNYISSKNGRYIAILEPGYYNVFITAEGYKSLSEDIIIYDKSDYAEMINKDFVLTH